MSIQQALQWSTEDEELVKFCSRRSNSLPLIVLVTVGYYGVDNQIGSDEIFYVYGFEKQRRLITKDATGRIFSIPVDYPVKFCHMNKPNQPPKQKAQTLEPIVEKWKFNPEMRWICADDDVTLTFNIDAKNHAKDKLGVLEMIDIFELKYALTHAMCERIDSKSTAIPDYMSINVSRAEGAVYANKLEYESWLQDLAELVSTFDHNSSELCNEIILFDKYKYNTNGYQHYEYIRVPQAGKVTNNYTQLHTSSNTNNDNNEYEEVRICNLNPLPLPPRRHFRQQTSTDERSISLPYLPLSKMCRSPMQIIPTSTPRRRAKTPPLQNVNKNDIEQLAEYGEPMTVRIDRVEELAEYGEAATVNRNNVPPSISNAPPEPVKRNIQGHLNNSNVPLEPPKRVSAVGKNGKHRLPPPPPDSIHHQICKPQEITPNSGNHMQHLQQLSDGNKNTVQTHSNADEKRPLTSYSHLKEIPTNLNWEVVSIEEVVHLINLMGISGCSETFRNNDVDGDILFNVIDRTTLINDFNLSDDQAHALISFVKDNKRPTAPSITT